MAKVLMSSFRGSNFPARLYTLTGLAFSTLGLLTPARAGDYSTQAAACAAHGPDFAMMEGGTGCVRIGGHVRVQTGANAGLTGNNWPAGHAAPATLRSDNPGIDAAPAGDVTHLRIHGGLEYPSPF